MKRLATLLSILSIISLSLFAGTTGKISGTVKDARNGESLVGVNITLVGTKLGAITDVDGRYVILNVKPGEYDLKASLLGYASTTVTNIRVEIDQTSEVNFILKEEAVQGEEVVVVAQRPVIQKDVSASTVSLSAKDIASIPTVSVAGAVLLQAGIQSNASGIVIRGAGSDQTAFMVDGFQLRDERNNYAYTNVSMTSVSDIQVQTGGFNAEYGNIRSGVVNVTTNDGSAQHYTVALLARMAPPQKQTFADAINSPDFYYIRPYEDPQVAYAGTNAWDAATQARYPTFPGWIAVAQQSLATGDSTKFLSPTAAKKLWEWQHRKDFSILKPNYNIDASLGGPFPFIGSQLGNLRFWASYVRQQSMYMIPLSTDAYRNWNGSLKLTSEPGEGMKLTIEGLMGQQTGTASSNAGQPGIFQPYSTGSPTNSQYISDALSKVSYIDARMFTYTYWAPTTVDFNTIGARLSKVLGPSTFYEVNVRRTASQYHTGPPDLRDTSKVYQFGNYYYTDEAPVGFWAYPSNAIDGMRMSVGMSTSRDSSKLATYDFKFDLTSQVDEHNQIKTGIQLTSTDNNVNYATVDTYLPTGTSWSHWHTYPFRASLYLQDKIEFEGMIANLGVRVDQSRAGGQWYASDNPFSSIFSGANLVGLDTVSKSSTKNILVVQPRLGISFPITVNSKIYFNYGHFYSMPTPDNLYLIRRLTGTNNVSLVADPNAPLPRTIAYELGFEQSAFDQYLLHIAGYYKDVSDERTTTRFASADSKVNYSLYTSNFYEDIRGFELTLSKNRGDWFQGFVNYTYMVSTSGRFGYAVQYQSPSDQRNYDLANYTDLYQTKPLPRPYARMNINFFTPAEYGPKVLGFEPFAAWKFNMLGTWQSGEYFTWAGGGSIPGVVNNVEWQDYTNFDFRITRTLHFGGFDLDLFADIYNIFNIKYMSYNYGFYDGNDFNEYMKSLHLPADIAGDASNTKLGYVNTPGNDRPGDYQSASKPYIHMPRLWQLAILNPRTFYYGIRFNYDLP